MIKEERHHGSNFSFFLLLKSKMKKRVKHDLQNDLEKTTCYPRLSSVFYHIEKTVS